MSNKHSPKDGCEFCTFKSNCAKHCGPAVNDEAKTARITPNRKQVQARNREVEDKMQRIAEAWYESLYENDKAQAARNAEDTPFCCIAPLKPNLRDGFFPPEIMRPMIDSFVGAINDGKVAYIQDLVTNEELSEVERVFKINPIIAGEETGIWLFCPSPPADQLYKFYCFMKTDTIRFARDCSVHAHLSYQCTTHNRKLYRAGFMSKVKGPNGPTFGHATLDALILHKVKPRPLGYTEGIP